MPKLIHADKRTLTRFQETPKYEGGLYDLDNNCYAWMVPNGSWGESNAGLVVGNGESLLIDTLWDLPFTKTMLDAMQSVTADAPIQTVVNTHADGDHFFGNELLADKTIITSKASYDEMLTTKPQSMVLLGRIGGLLKMIPLFDADYAQQIFGDWNSPERIMVNTHTLYRQWSGRKDHPKVPELLNILRKQGILAHKLPDAQPQIMRKKS